MGFDILNFKKELDKSLQTFDKKTSQILCEKIISQLKDNPADISVEDLGKILLMLRNKKMFELMAKTGETAAGVNKQSLRIRKVYAQSLIELGKFKDALEVLDKLADDTKDSSDRVAKKEYNEAKALTGRVFKQMYVNTKDFPGVPREEYLDKAVKSYYEIYEKARDENTYPGINVVALLKRAERDKVNLQGYGNADKIAQEIFDVTKYKIDDNSATMWDYAIAIESLVALNKAEGEDWGNLMKYLGKYVNSDDADAFELNSTLRQMEQVWQLNTDSKMGDTILPILRAMLLKQEGSEVTVDVSKTGFTKRRNLTDGEEKIFQKVLGAESFQSYQWWLKGVKRCMAIGRIGKEAGKGEGTGFLLRGSDLSDKIKDEFILLTNAHVVSNDEKNGSLFPDEAVIIFEALDPAKEFKVSDEIIWSSPKDKLDATILRFRTDDLEKLKELIKSELNEEEIFYPISKRLPVIDKKSSVRVYIIGHPGGGTLQFSFQDNVLLEPGDPLLRYRTPTEGGSSGSPVFNENWELIGLHHASVSEANANEGIWIQSVKKKLSEDL